jgi:hypothetical protein
VRSVQLDLALRVAKKLASASFVCRGCVSAQIWHYFASGCQHSMPCRGRKSKRRRAGAAAKFRSRRPLEAGKSYTLLGGFDYQSGLIPILSGTRMCRFAIQDDADKTLVSRKPERAKQ